MTTRMLRSTLCEGQCTDASLDAGSVKIACIRADEPAGDNSYQRATDGVHNLHSRKFAPHRLQGLTCMI